MLSSTVKPLSYFLINIFFLLIFPQTILAIPPEKQAEIFLQKGLIKLADDNNEKEALNYFNQAIKLNPNYAEAYYQRGQIYTQYFLGENRKPEQLHTGCFYVDNVTVCRLDLHNNWRGKNLDKAQQDLDKALELKPNYGPVYYQKALIFEKQNDHQNAINFFRAASELYIQEGIKYLEMNQHKQAGDFLEYSYRSYKEITHIQEKYKTPSGSSAQSPERQKSPEQLCKEAAQLIKIPDYLAALEKYRQAARLFKQRGNEKYYQETQKIIQALEQL